MIEHARSLVSRQLLKLGGEPELRIGVKTDNGHQIVDVSGLNLDQPMRMEDAINHSPGVVENGIFARRPADVLVLARAAGVELVCAK